LPQTNKNTTVSKSKIFSELNKALLFLPIYKLVFLNPRPPSSLQNWLCCHGPFDAVIQLIDVANVDLYNSKAFSFSQVVGFVQPSSKVMIQYFFDTMTGNS